MFERLANRLRLCIKTPQELYPSIKYKTTKNEPLQSPKPTLYEIKDICLYSGYQNKIWSSFLGKVTFSRTSSIFYLQCLVSYKKLWGMVKKRENMNDQKQVKQWRITYKYSDITLSSQILQQILNIQQTTIEYLLSVRSLGCIK